MTKFRSGAVDGCGLGPMLPSANNRHHRHHIVLVHGTPDMQYISALSQQHEDARHRRRVDGLYGDGLDASELSNFFADASGFDGRVILDSIDGRRWLPEGVLVYSGGDVGPAFAHAAFISDKQERSA